MKKCLAIVVLIVLGNQSYSQTTWAEHAAEVFYNNCTTCHNPNGIGPMSLMSYTDAVTYAPLIQSNVLSNQMPPWTADTGYTHFAQERILTQAERDIILDWISDGTQEGPAGQAPPPPVYNGDQILPGVPDLTIEAFTYMSKANTQDDYVCFVVPSGLLTDRKVRAFEVIPGNREIVHHCLIYYDNTGWATTDSTGDCAGPVTSVLMGGYTPGSSPIIFPSTGSFSAGMNIPAGADIVFAMHYPAGSYGMFDSTKVNFYFYPEPVTNFREVHCEPIVQDWAFSIAADTWDTVEVATSPIPDETTVLSVFPHMHLIGSYIETWAVTPTNDTINFCRIPLWDFDWQDFYWFEYMRHVPAGTIVYGKGIWNNTVTNPHNPNNPPITVSAGLNTTDEMFLIYFHYMDYLSGDEYINIDSLTTEFLNVPSYADKTAFAKVFPNPFNSSTDIQYFLNSSAFVSLYIYDLQGRVVNKLVREQQMTGTQIVNWDGTNDAGNEVGAGIYVYSVLVDGVHYSGKVIKK